jgi:hypothetical protein
MLTPKSPNFPPAPLVTLASLAALLSAPLPLAAQSDPSAIPPSAIPDASTVSVEIKVNTLANRHTISPYIYGGAFPPSAAYIQQSGLTLSRWGGNSTSRYNWTNGDTNLAADWYFENYGFSSSSFDSTSASFITNVSSAGGSPILTIPMLPWVAKDAVSASFSIKKYGRQCGSDPYRPDNGDGLLTDCSTDLTGNNPADAHVPLLDSPGKSDPAGSVYRSKWLEAEAADFGKQPHFYNMDNEPDIWSGTHRDVHPEPTGYDEMASTYLARAAALKTFDPLAVRFGPVFCCWWFYWNGSDNNDKAAHGGLDFLPWWLNEIWFADQVSGKRSLDVFDVHAYFNGPNATSNLTTTRAAALRQTRDWWDSTYVSESGAVNQPWATQLQPDRTIAFVIPRMRALANTIYPGTPVSFTEWNGALAGETDFSTALADADAYGILGREGMYAASRWVAASQGGPGYEALLLYRNADGRHDGFQSLSVQAANTLSPNLFSVYASTDPAGDKLTLLVVNKDPANTAKATISVEGFSPNGMKTYTLSQAKPATIVASSTEAWSATQSFAPYSATLIVASGSTPQKPAVEWALNPDVLASPASSSVTISPAILSGKGTVKLTAGSGTGSLTVKLTQPKLAVGSDALVTLTAPSKPGLYPFSITGVDSSNVTQSQQGWLLVGNPAATLTKTGDNQSAPRGKTLTLTANFVPGSSGATPGNVTILFTASAGKLSSRIVRTGSSGAAEVTLTLPDTPGKVTVTAQEPIPWGGEKVTFTETAQ